MPIVNIPDDSLLVFDYNGSLWQIPKGEGGSNTIGITDENNDEWYIDAGDGNTYDLQIQASDDVTKTWFLELGVNMSELIGNPIIIGDSSGIDTSDATAAAGDILSGKTAYVDGEKITGTIASKSSSNLTASGKTVIVPAGYYASQYTKDVATGSATAPLSIRANNATISTGTNTLTLSRTITITPSVSAGYISSGTAEDSSVSLTASLPVIDTATITPTTSDQTIAAGTYIKGKQTIKGDANLVSSNIASGVSIFGVAGSHQSGTDTSDATAAAGDILSGKTAYVNGSKITGTIATKTKDNLSASGKTVTVPAGYYASQYTKDVATGSATAPASISGSSATVSTGTNTLTLSKTVSVTPSVTSGYVSSGTAGNSSVSLTASVTTKAAATITPTTTDQTISSGTYLTGAQTISGDANLVAGNIKSGISIFGVSGSYAGTKPTLKINYYQRGSGTPSPTNIRDIYPGLTVTAAGVTIPVCAGTLNLETGVLSVSKILIEFRGKTILDSSIVGSHTFNQAAQSDPEKTYYRCSIIANTFPNGGIVCNMYPTISIAASNTNTGVAFTYSSGILYLRDYANIKSLSELDTFFKNNRIQFVLTYATPVTYQLTSSELSAILQ